MPDKTLYFPYMRVPKNEWFTRVLLYWDEVGTIVPDQFGPQLEVLGSHTMELIQSGLVRPVAAEHFVYQIPNFREAFLELIKNNEEIQSRRDIPLDSQSTFKLHLDKMGGLADDLEDMKLARHAENPWFEVEQSTANLFMAYLASVMGRHADLEMVPITDSAQGLAVFSDNPQQPLSPQLMIEKMRVEVLEEMLPAPAEPISVNELVAFKNNHSDSLKQFRGLIESKLIDISAISDLELRQERLRYFKDELTGPLEQIVARMRERGWLRITLGAIARLALPAISIGTGTAAGNPVTVGAAVKSLVTAIHSTRSDITGSNEPDSPLAYAALAQKQFAD